MAPRHIAFALVLAIATVAALSVGYAAVTAIGDTFANVNAALSAI